MENTNTLKLFFNKLFKYSPPHQYNFFLSNQELKEIDKNPVSSTHNIEPTAFDTNLAKNLDFIKSKYNSLINSDIVLREFSLTASNKKFNAVLIYIDGMIDSQILNEFVLYPLMLRNKSNTKNAQISSVNTNTLKDFNLANYIYNQLLPQNNAKKISNFEEAFTNINIGNCLLLIDTINIGFNLDIKGFKQRSVASPQNEVVIRGSQEAFVENIRTNTSMLRRLINNENLTIENCNIGTITKTPIAICYLNDITNNDLVAEVKYRINNLNIDYLLSSGQLEQLIQDNSTSLFPQILATERPDKAAVHLLEGRVIVIVNGSPYVLILPGILSDFLSSPEDSNFKFQFSNLLKGIRLIAIFFALFLPGIYVAITTYHHELLPTELLFTIEAARETVPFPSIIEILLMEISFELIREAGIRVPSPIGPTIGIVGGLILGEAAVSANLVSPILIIVVAITAICSFSIPDYSLNFTIRILRFMYIFLGYLAGFLGIAAGIYVQLIFLCNLKSFGCPYIIPFLQRNNKRTATSYFIPPIWKRENRSTFVTQKKKYSQGKFSMLWKHSNLN